MSRQLKRIISLGIQEGVSDFDAQRIRMLNIGVFLALIMAWLTIPVVLVLGGEETLPGTILLVLVAAFVFWLQKTGRPKAAAAAVTFMGLILVSAQFWLLGPEHGVHYWSLPLVLFPVLFFPRESGWSPAILAVIAYGLFVVMGSVDYHHHGYPIGHLITQFLAGALMLALGLTMRQLMLRVESRTEQQKTQIASQSRVIEQFPAQNPSAVLRLDDEVRVVYGNPAAQVLLQSMGLNEGDCFPVPYSVSLTDDHTHGPFEIQVEDRWIEFTIWPVREFGFYNVYGTDTSALKQLDLAREEVSRALGREREVSRLKEEFLASLSHELRTPLNAVMGLSEALQEEVYGPLTEKQNGSLQTIWDSGQRLLAMFDDLLDFARIGAGRFPTQLGVVDLRSCVQAVVRRKTREVTDGGLRLFVDDGDFDTRATVDMRHVQRILLNLMDNAIKFTPTGGRVGIQISEVEDDDALELTVWDTGIGIPEERQAYLFQPFVQVEGGLSRRYGGTGLGLALTGRLCQLLGARLRVESVEGEGSRFILKVSRAHPVRLKVYADPVSPACFVMSEWLADANLDHLVRWLGVERHSEISPDDPSWVMLNRNIDNERELLAVLAPDVDLRDDIHPFSTRRLLAAMERIWNQMPDRFTEAQRLVGKAIWVDGKDLSEWSAIEELLVDFALVDLNDDMAEIHTIRDHTDHWRAVGMNRLPMMVCNATGETRLGIDKRSEVMNFVLSQLAADSSGSQDSSTD